MISRVRPLGLSPTSTVNHTCTNNTKNVYKQLVKIQWLKLAVSCGWKMGSYLHAGTDDSDENARLCWSRSQACSACTVLVTGFSKCSGLRTRKDIYIRLPLILRRLLTDTFKVCTDLIIRADKGTVICLGILSKAEERPLINRVLGIHGVATQRKFAQSPCMPDVRHCLFPYL